MDFQGTEKAELRDFQESEKAKLGDFPEPTCYVFQS